MSLEPAQMHKFMLDNNIPVMFYAAKELPLNVEPSLLKKAGLSMVKIYPDDDIYLIVALPKGATKSYKYTRTPYLVNEIQTAYNKAFKANALYYNMNDLNIPVDYFNNAAVLELYHAALHDSRQKLFVGQQSFANRIILRIFTALDILCQWIFLFQLFFTSILAHFCAFD